jgi:hypothetical protein
VKAIDWNKLIQQVKEFVLNIDFRAIMNSIINSAKTLWALFAGEGGTAATTAENLSDAIENIGPAIETVTKAVVVLEKGWKGFTIAIKAAQDFTLPFFQLLTDAAFLFNDAIDAIINTFKNVTTAIDNFFQPFDASIRKAIESVANLGQKILDLIPGLKKTEEISTGNSVFPDMVMWADRASESITGINNTLANTENKLIKLGVLTGSALQGFLAAEQTQLRAASGIPTAPQGLPIASAGGLPTSQAPQEQVLNATFVFDDQEVGKMTTVISGRQQQNARRVTGQTSAQRAGSRSR